MGLIPARGGSKGIPRKNLRKLAGTLLVEYSVGAARASGVIDRLVLTTESDEIAEVAARMAVDDVVRRPSYLASDDTPMLDVVKHALIDMENRGYTPQVVVLLQPTAPLRLPQHIAKAVGELIRGRCDSVVSVVRVPAHLSPHYVMRIEEGVLRNFLPEGKGITRRQDTPPAYYRDGTVYATWRRVIVEDDSLYGDRCRALILPRSQSLPLDTTDDWEFAEWKIAQRALSGGKSNH